ncbi:hypothetical protein CRUP_027040 [Coryphaenoides rupestris]|nr:hypothetical protein CRUP_027040 [Coryphaenoides rupestris]
MLTFLCGMPKGPEHFSERAGWNSSKNAKDQSNNATAWVSLGGHRGHRRQAGPGGLGERLSHFDSGKDSEKDSGYSGETGTPAHVSQPHRKNSRSAVTAGNNNNRSGIGGANRDAGRYEELTPVYVIQNLVVKQGNFSGGI